MTQTQSNYRVRSKAMISVTVDELARSIKNLTDEELELLEMKLTGDHTSLKKRLNDVKQKKVRLLSHKEVFKKK